MERKIEIDAPFPHIRQLKTPPLTKTMRHIHTLEKKRRKKWEYSGCYQLFLVLQS